MKLVVLDGFTANPGDLLWDDLQALGELSVYDRTEPVDVIERAGDADIVLTNKTALGRDVMNALPRLKYIGVLATGVNVVDIPAARERGIIVTNVPAYSTPSVAQMVFAHILHFTQRVTEHAHAVNKGKWATSDDFCFWDYPLTELAGQTMGIIGFGQIGQAVARLALAFDMNVLFHNRSPVSHASDGCTQTNLDDVLVNSDIVTLHCPLTNQTRHMMNADRLAKMKSSAILINTGRGPLVDEQALADALNQGRIAGAGVDVLSSEPPQADNPLIGAKNCFITPHIAWATKAARERLLNTVTHNVRAFLDGEPVNVVS